MIPEEKDNSSRFGKAARLYKLTPKALEFIEAFNKWAEEHNISHDEILPVLRKLAEQDPSSLEDTLEGLVKKGYMEEKDCPQ